MTAGETFVEAGGRKIWCAVVGEPGARPPLVCIAGGPGASHHYLMPLTALSADRQVVFYDPLGSGRSERPAIAWTTDVYTEEVAAVVRGLGLERYHLFVHSAGGFAGLPYVAGRPAGLGAVILSGVPVSIPAHAAHVRGLLARMGLAPFELTTFERAERDARYRDVAYARIANAFFARHLCLVRPLPREFTEGLPAFNPRAHSLMKGGLVLYTTELATWDFTARLGEIMVPTLFTRGGHDILGSEACEDVRRGIPDCEQHVFEKSSHMPHLEERDAHLDRVARFLALHD